MKIKSILMISMITLMMVGCESKPSMNKAEREVNMEQPSKVFHYGTTAYGVQMGDTGLNPHENYSGWSCVRYGVGETLFKLSDEMTIEPWLATSYEIIGDHIVKITLRENITFTSGRALDAEAVKECLEELIRVHDRAPYDLQIKEIIAEGQVITISSEENASSVIHYLCDPYAAIIDMKVGVTADKNVSGTGPFKAIQVTNTDIQLVKNENYWNGPVKMDEVKVSEIADGSTLMMALQSGEIDAAQGLAYTGLHYFKQDEAYNVNSSDTSRLFFTQFNKQNSIFEDSRVRQAIALAIDKESFVSHLLQDNGTVARGPFPQDFKFANPNLPESEFNLDKAKLLLEEVGFEDTNGNGYLEQNGEDIVLTWLTYPGRQELPLLAEFAQAALKEIGLKVKVHSTQDHQDILNKGEWDIYASAFVAAPTGEPEYFFKTHCLETSTKNRGGYHNERLEALASELANEGDSIKRGQLIDEMQQLIVEDGYFIFISHLKMSFAMKNKVVGFEPHPSDYYEITAHLDYRDEMEE